MINERACTIFMKSRPGYDALKISANNIMSGWRPEEINNLSKLQSVIQLFSVIISEVDKYAIKTPLTSSEKREAFYCVLRELLDFDLSQESTFNVVLEVIVAMIILMNNTKKDQKGSA